MRILEEREYPVAEATKRHEESVYAQVHKAWGGIDFTKRGGLSYAVAKPTHSIGEERYAISLDESSFSLENIERHPELSEEIFNSSQEARSLIQEIPDKVRRTLVICDIELPGTPAGDLATVVRLRELAHRKPEESSAEVGSRKYRVRELVNAHIDQDVVSLAGQVIPLGTTRDWCDKALHLESALAKSARRRSERPAGATGRDTHDSMEPGPTELSERSASETKLGSQDFERLGISKLRNVSSEHAVVEEGLTEAPVVPRHDPATAASMMTLTPAAAEETSRKTRFAQEVLRSQDGVVSSPRELDAYLVLLRPGAEIPPEQLADAISQLFHQLRGAGLPTESWARVGTSLVELARRDPERLIKLGSSANVDQLGKTYTIIQVAGSHLVSVYGGKLLKELRGTIRRLVIAGGASERQELPTGAAALLLVLGPLVTRLEPALKRSYLNAGNQLLRHIECAASHEAPVSGQGFGDVARTVAVALGSTCFALSWQVPRARGLLRDLMSSRVIQQYISRVQWLSDMLSGAG